MRPIEQRGQNFGWADMCISLRGNYKRLSRLCLDEFCTNTASAANADSIRGLHQVGDDQGAHGVEREVNQDGFAD